MRSGMKKEIPAWVIITSALLILAAVLSFGMLRQRAQMRSLENCVSDISFPQGIEKIEMRSSVGDPGRSGDGGYSTLRVVLLVKAELGIEELRKVIENMNLRFPGHYESLDNAPIFYVTHCIGSTFKSPVNFALTFAAPEELGDHAGYYFIEFVE